MGRKCNCRPARPRTQAIDFIRGQFEAISHEHRGAKSEHINVCSSLTCMTNTRHFEAQWKHMWATPLAFLDGKISELSLEYAKVSPATSSTRH